MTDNEYWEEKESLGVWLGDYYHEHDWEGIEEVMNDR